MSDADELRAIVVEARSAFGDARSEEERARVRTMVEERLTDLERSVTEGGPDRGLLQRISKVRHRLLRGRPTREGRPFG